MAENGVRVQEKGQVTIPRAIRKKLNLKQGDLVIFQETEAGILIKPAAVVVEDNLRKEVTTLVHAVLKNSRIILLNRLMFWWSKLFKPNNANNS
jgi:AbrB family looped-hinge helix DNA binding protein